LEVVTDGEPVRSLCLIKEESSTEDEHSIVTGSQGGLLSCLSIPSCTTSIQPGGDGTRHPHNITSLLSVESGGYVSGCKDGVIRIFDGAHSFSGELKGHENAVTSLAWLPLSCSDDSSPDKELLLSGSWDGTARVWSLSQMECMAVLGGHENTVSVVGLPPLDGSIGRVATASAGIAQGNSIVDHKVRIWHISPSAGSYQAKLVHTVANDHNGPIRGIAFDPHTNHLLTCSNDATVKIRDLQGNCLTTLNYPSDGSEPMLLSLTTLHNAKVVAAAEDGHAVVWDLVHHTHRLIPHPSTVWTVLALPKGDFATACHDGYTRIFTLDATRTAPTQQIQQFQKASADSKAKSNSGPTPEEIAKLPKWEMNALTQGRSEGQVQIFNKNNKAIAAQWSDVSKTWIEVGEVMGTNQNAGQIDGVSYDHVFPIEIDVPGGGVTSLQIGYNNGENPFVVAQKFIDDHMLDQNYLSEIADYIQKRAGADGNTPTLGMTDAAAAAPTPMDISTNTSTTPTYQHLPFTTYRSFENGTEPKVFNKIINKCCEFYDQETASTTITKDHLTTTLQTLSDTLCATNRYHATSIPNSQLTFISKLISQWNIQHVFPILDISRLIALHPDASKMENQYIWESIVSSTIEKCQQMKLDPTSVQGTTAAVAIPMMSMRLFTNCFRGGGGSLKAVSSHLDRILDCAELFAISENKNVRLSVATLILNASSYIKSSSAGTTSSTADHILSIVGTIIGSGLYESEATVRVLVALGTLLLADDSIKVKAKSLHMSSMVDHAGSQHGEKAKAVAGEIQLILA